MQSVRKKTRPAPPQRRLALLLMAVVLLAGVVAAALMIERAPQEAWPTVVSTAQVLFEYPPEQVVSIHVDKNDSAPWTALQTDGLLMLDGETGFPLSESTSAALLEAASILTCEAVLTDDPVEYRDHLADFGLDMPRYQAEVTYADGVAARLSIGNPGTENKAWYYMTVAGDDRLFSVSRGVVESLFISRELLRDVESPVIHKARINRITLTSPEGVRAQWTLQGPITTADAIDRWQLTAPFVYPADAQAMTSLLGNIANLRLGAYVGPATTENLQTFGFDEPRLTIDVHMAAGTIGMTNAEGAIVPQDWPESTVTFVIGGEKSDLVDYVRFGDDIYISSRLTMGMFLDYDVQATMSRYPVMVALGNLAGVTIVNPHASIEYVLTRTERVAENNELVTDEEGSVVHDVTVTRNGEPCDYDAFAAAYNDWSLVTVSGVLPEDWQPTEPPQHRYIFTDVDGTVHEVGLTTFDALHDAVIVDGHTAFYLIKGGFSAALPE